MTGDLKTINVWSDSRERGQCKGQSCRALIEWATIVASGRRMCFDAPVTAIRSFADPQTGRQVDVIDLAANHWATCPERKRFSRRRQ
jgi:hypothetical protein